MGSETKLTTINIAHYLMPTLCRVTNRKSKYTKFMTFQHCLVCESKSMGTPKILEKGKLAIKYN